MATTLNRYSTLKTDPLRNFRFIAEFTIVTGEVFDTKIRSFKTGFQTITGLSINTQSIPYREGGYNTTIHQVPGMTTFTPVTFQRGAVVGNDEAITWMKGLFAAGAGEGLPLNGKDFRVHVNVWVLDHPVALNDSDDTIDKAAKMKFKIHNAWITTLSYSDLNAGNQGLLFESMTLVHEGLSVSYTTTDASGNLLA